MSIENNIYDDRTPEQLSMLLQQLSEKEATETVRELAAAAARRLLLLTARVNQHIRSESARVEEVLATRPPPSWPKSPQTDAAERIAAASEKSAKGVEELLLMIKQLLLHGQGGLT